MADFAFFQVDVSWEEKKITFRRITDTHHTSNVFASACYIDAEKLEKAYTDSVAAKDGKVFRFPIPGDLALAAAKVDLGDNKHTYVITFP